MRVEVAHAGAIRGPRSSASGARRTRSLAIYVDYGRPPRGRGAASPLVFGAAFVVMLMLRLGWV